MPDDVINIHIDSTFSEADLLGEYSIPVVSRFYSATDSFVDSEVLYTASPSVSGAVDKQTVIFLTDTTVSGEEDLDVLLTTASGDSSYIDLTTNFFAQTAYTNLYDDVYVGFIGGQKYSNTRDFVASYWIPVKFVTASDFETEYSNIILKLVTKDVDTESSFPGTTYTGIDDVVVDSEFGGWVPHVVDFDMFSSTSGIHDIAFEILFGDKADLVDLPFNVFCTTTGISYINNEVFCTILYIEDIDFDVLITSSGNNPYLEVEAACALDDLPYMGFDVDLYSLKISNFYPGEDEYMTSDDLIHVDVTDDVYNVVTSGTYFVIDGAQVSGTYNAITDGYRIYYDSPTDYGSLLGSTEVLVHAENDNGDSLEQSFYITYGYQVTYYGI